MAVGLVTEAATNNIRILAILRPTSTSKNPVDFMTIVVRETIPPHLAKRFSEQTPTCGAGESDYWTGKERWVADFRVLDYEIIKDNAGDLGIP
jgi:hypothetical protein